MSERLKPPPFLWLLLAMAFLTCGNDCASTGAKEKPVLYPVGSEPILVVHDYVFSSQRDWESSPWARMTDNLSFPVFVAIDSHGRACLVDAETWAVGMVGRRIRCETSWRFAR